MDITEPQQLLHLVILEAEYQAILVLVVTVVLERAATAVSLVSRATLEIQASPAIRASRAIQAIRASQVTAGRAFLAIAASLASRATVAFQAFLVTRAIRVFPDILVFLESAVLAVSAVILVLVLADIQVHQVFLVIADLAEFLDGLELADILESKMKPLGLAVVMDADHLCMQWRGVKDSDSKMLNSVMRGTFLKDPNLRREFLSLLGSRYKSNN